MEITKVNLKGLRLIIQISEVVGIHVPKARPSVNDTSALSKS